ncbi:hypothetical protein BCR36DRAFT_33806 [Piromyces finnis]|uniref:sphingomyelin phosphodiesterase n=1 Tax=Piromyces finnis TaxID=1754191 RepID=A0A1Y1VBP1_9FUNG|nr:hypothetical protein BCR36DRAFT_33806 [Piromyces finnis]|eukprot:ORX52109.1 hypothetical protein BCR36DRAFT_33806 [Piromyces finnis]
MNSDIKAKENVTSKAIKILTYNSFIRPPFISTLSRDYRDERLALFGERIFKKYDIITFQEMFSFLSNRIEHIIEVAKEYGLLYHCRTPKNPIWKFASDGGLLLLSRYPIVDFDIHKLIRGIHGDYFSDKSVLYAKIEVLPQRYLHLFSAHLQASYSNYPHVNISKSVRIRFTQLTEIRNFIQCKTAKVKKSEPIFLLGDLNVNSRLYEKNTTVSSKEYKIMMDIFRGKRSFYHPSVDLCGLCCGWCSDGFRIKKIKCYPSEDDELNNTFEVYDIGRYFLKYHPNTSCKIFPKKFYKENDIMEVKKSLDYVFLFNKIEPSNLQTQQLYPELKMLTSTLERPILFDDTIEKTPDNLTDSKKDTNKIDISNIKEKDRHRKINSSFDAISNLQKKSLTYNPTEPINPLELTIENSLNRKKNSLFIQDYLHTISKYYKIKKIEIEKFKVDNKPFQYLSDHYGVCFLIEIYN